jgi:AcrR family transcriptional regulator
MPAAVDEKIILDAALAVWREQGFRDATTRKVAERAGIGEITLFRRFGDKVGLFGAALSTEAEVFRAAGATYSGDLNEDLVRTVDAYQDLLARNGGIILDFLIEAPKNPDLARIRQIPMTAVASVASVIARYQAEGLLGPGSPMELVTELLGPLVMRYAVSRAQVGLQMYVSADVVVARFLAGSLVQRDSSGVR